MDINVGIINDVVINGSTPGEASSPTQLSDILTFVETLEGSQKWFFESSFSLSDSYATGKLISFADAIAFVSVAEGNLVETKLEFSSFFGLDDTVHKIVHEAVEDTFAINDSVSIGKVIAAILDSLGLGDSFLAISTITKAFESTLAFDDTFSFRQRIEQEDAIVFADEVLAKITQILSWNDTLALADVNDFTFLMQLTLEDDFEIGDSFFEIIQRVLALEDSFGVLGQFTIDGDTYLVWAVNPKTKGAYKLKYPQRINSFARIAGKNLICADDGIYEIAGTDDDGTAINAFLKTGFEDFNDPERHYPGEKIKQLLNAYLVLSAEGETLLKITSTRRGEAIETWFKCRENADVVSKKQISLSNSLRSVLFQFELRPLEGLPAKFREIEIIPLFLSRSI